MKKILAEEIEDGMVLSEDLAGPNGNIILPKGVALKSSLASRLIGWGIKQVTIEGDDQPEEIEGFSIDEYKTHLKGLFSDGIENDKNKILFELLVQLKESDK